MMIIVYLVITLLLYSNIACVKITTVVVKIIKMEFL